MSWYSLPFAAVTRPFDFIIRFNFNLWNNLLELILPWIKRNVLNLYNELKRKLGGRAKVISSFINMYKNAVWPFQDLNFSSKSQLNLLTFSPNCTECGANFYAECHMRFKLTTCGAYVLFVPTAIEFFLYINRKSSQNQSICQLATMQRAFFQ